MPPDFDFARGKQAQPHGFVFGRRIESNGEDASPVEPVPVSTHDPGGGLVGMPAFRPVPEAVEQPHRDFCKRPRRHDVTMVIGPTPPERVELTNERQLD